MRRPILSLAAIGAEYVPSDGPAPVADVSCVGDDRHVSDTREGSIRDSEYGCGFQGIGHASILVIQGRANTKEGRDGNRTGPPRRG